MDWAARTLLRLVVLSARARAVVRQVAVVKAHHCYFVIFYFTVRSKARRAHRHVRGQAQAETKVGVQRSIRRWCDARKGHIAVRIIRYSH